MSGGSFNYLCTKDIHDIAYGIGEEWDDMLAELDELCPAAAEEMREIRLSTEEFTKKFGAQWDRLTPLLQAVEWWRSGDYGKESVDRAIEIYRSTPFGTDNGTNSSSVTNRATEDSTD